MINRPLDHLRSASTHGPLVGIFLLQRFGLRAAAAGVLAKLPGLVAAAVPGGHFHSLLPDGYRVFF